MYIVYMNSTTEMALSTKVNKGVGGLQIPTLCLLVPRGCALEEEEEEVDERGGLVGQGLPYLCLHYFPPDGGVGKRLTVQVRVGFIV